MQSIYGFRGATASNLSTFRTDFPVGDEPAPKLQLTTSWRNPPRVLDLANAVSDWSLEWNREDDTNRPVRRLTAGRDIPGEDVRVAWFDRRDREVDWVADQLAAEYREFSDDLATPGTAATGSSPPPSSCAGTPTRCRSTTPSSPAGSRWR